MFAFCGLYDFWTVAAVLSKENKSSAIVPRFRPRRPSRGRRQAANWS
jgi:hypothetical protein